MKFFHLSLLPCFFILIGLPCFAQNSIDESIGPVGIESFSVKKFDNDSSANALVISEIGKAGIMVSADELKVELQYEYHVRIKVLKQEGISSGDVEVDLWKDNKNGEETISDVKGTCYNLNSDGSISEAIFDKKKVFMVNEHESYSVAKFAIPGVRVGSIIQYSYIVHSPFYSEFHSWDFQSDVPKITSTFTANIPANYEYRISLKGFLKLTEQSSTLEKDCFNLGQSGKADCSKLVFTMRNVPAFHTEKFMLAKSNYLSGLKFELTSFKSFRGYTKTYTETWKDEERYLAGESDFGGQIRRGIDFYKHKLDTTLTKANESDSIKARKVYAFIRDRLKWNKKYGMFSHSTLKNIFDNRSGSSGDINLSLISALRSVGIKADPLLISTRSESAPRKIFPVLSDFNYVIASVDLGNEKVLLDATDQHLAFGMISKQCMVDEGRLFPKSDSSRWVSIKVPFSSKSVSFYDMKLDDKGNMKGKGTFYSFGYKALEEKENRKKFTTDDEFLDAKTKDWINCHIESFTEKGLDDPEAAYENVFDMDLTDLHPKSSTQIDICPFLSHNFTSNPFSLNERLFPIDFAFNIEEAVIIKIHLPTGYKLHTMPIPFSTKLPNNGGYFIMEQESDKDTYSLNYKLVFAKSFYDKDEYYALKEFISQIINTEKKHLVLVRI